MSLFPALPYALDQTMPCNVCHSKNAETDASTQQLLQRSGQWTIYWKLNIVAGADFSLLSWWENASLYMGMPDLADRAITALTLPVTTTVAEGSFRIMKGLLTADHRGMSHDTQIGYLLAMVNGDVNHRIPQWAFV